MRVAFMVVMGLFSTGCPTEIPPQDAENSPKEAADGPAAKVTRHPRLAWGIPTDVQWVIEIPSPARAQESLGPVLLRIDTIGRLFEGIRDRLGKKLGVRPTSSLLWMGSGIDSSAPMAIASRPATPERGEILISVGVNKAERFLEALRGALGDDVTLGPSIGRAQVLVDGGRAAAVVLFARRRAVVWLAPSDTLAAGAILQLMAPEKGSPAEHPLFQAAIDVEIARARAEVQGEGVQEIARVRGDVRSALLLSGTWASLLLPRPFIALGGVLTTTANGENVAAFVSARFAPSDMKAVRARLGDQRASPLACSLQQGAAVFTTFPVGAGLDDALAPGAPLPASDRLHKGAALALYPHASENAAAASDNAVLGLGQWMFAGRPKDASASVALAKTLGDEGLARRPQSDGANRFASPPKVPAAKRLEALVADDVFVLGLGAPPAFERAVAHRQKKAFAESCTEQFGALAVVVDGNHLAEVVRVSRESPLTRLSARLAATARRFAAVLQLREQGVVVGATLDLRPPPQ